MKTHPNELGEGGRKPAQARMSDQNRNFPIIVHSHLRWDWVWQRPQQFLSRLSRNHRILFVEEPRICNSEDGPRSTLRDVSEYPNIMVLQSCFPEKQARDGAWLDKQRRRLVQQMLAGPLASEFANPVQWFYDPMAVKAFAGKMDESAIVYDCMDQLSQFRGAPPELVRRERELLALADVVFAGGPKIHRAKAAYNSNCHAYGCGVDVKHFAQAREEATEVPADLAGRVGSGPVLGFFGVVDERMDYELIATLADADPNWNLVIVGPQAKVEESTLPKRQNIHWMGGRDYSQLPAYTKRFDVCMMPFALNEATEFINPTKALEYMAAGKPIVSSAVEDVVLQFSQVTAIARSHAEFVELCRRAVNAPDHAMIEQGIALAKRNSWEAIVRNLEAHIQEALAEKNTVAA
jgi:glycosyltransferase involved in cell wall biosynthesis